MFDKSKTVCFSGHRRGRLPKTQAVLDSLRVKIYEEIDAAVKAGYDTFLFGACYGFDLLCAEMVMLRQRVMRRKEGNIRLIAVIPFEEQAVLWSDEDREHYYTILPECDDVLTFYKRYSKDCYSLRNQYMMENSSRLICYYDGGKGGTADVVSYAKENGCEVINLL